jgi:hypothetical protein
MQGTEIWQLIEGSRAPGPIKSDDYSGFAELADKDHTMRQGWIRTFVGGLGLAVVCSTGCQVHVGGQTLPSPYYMNDDVQYFAPGPEFNLSREAAALKANQAEQVLP